MEGVNIWSGSASSIGAALTNMTDLAKKKGRIKNDYPVTVCNITFVDAEAAYQSLKGEDDERNDTLMSAIIAEKFLQHTRLYDAVEARGGVEWLEKCNHVTFARSAGMRSWEGNGRGSRFIRNLIAGYEMARMLRG